METSLQNNDYNSSVEISKVDCGFLGQMLVLISFTGFKNAIILFEIIWIIGHEKKQVERIQSYTIRSGYAWHTFLGSIYLCN